MFEGVGTSDLPLTSTSDKAKALMRQGFACIHCFWFDEAIRSFRDAIAEDPQSAIAWCGLYAALTQPWNYNNDFKAEAEFAIKRAVALSESASEVEQLLIVAYRSKSLGGDDRNGPYEKAMLDLIQKHPKLKEPRLLLGGIRCQMCMTTSYTPTGDVRGDLEFVAKLIEPVLAQDSVNAGALHYHIHAYEPFHPERAVRSADLIGKAAFRSSHMVHMAGHIYHRVGRYDDAKRVFSRARAIEEEDAKTLNVTPYEVNWNYGHNRSFLSASLAENGDIEAAMEAAKGQSWAEGDIFWRAGDWAKASEWTKKRFGSQSTTPNSYFFRGMEAVSGGNWFDARLALENLEKSFAERSKDKAPAQYHTQLRMHDAMRHELTGAIRMMEGRTDEGIAAYEKAVAAFSRIEYSEPEEYARVPHVNYGLALLKADEPEKAFEVFQRGLRVRKNSFWLKQGLREAEVAAKGN